VLAAAVVAGLFLRSRRSRVTSSNAMSEVAVSGRAVKVTRNPPPTRRQRRLAREESAPPREASGVDEEKRS
jgi:PiT family inorganic phosphate transporter